MFTYIHVVVFVFVLPEVIKLLKCYIQSVIPVLQSFNFMEIKKYCTINFIRKTVVIPLCTAFIHLQYFILKFSCTLVNVNIE